MDKRLPAAAFAQGADVAGTRLATGGRDIGTGQSGQTRPRRTLERSQPGRIGA